MRDQLLAVAIVVTLATALNPVAALAQVEGEHVGPPGQPVDLGSYAGPLRFDAGPGGVLELQDGRRFADVLEARVGPAGELVLINDVELDTYVEGIAEMPARWPMEALKAQAVAARTYAWYQASLGTFNSRGYDICPTVACQVFRGREAVEAADVGQRWAQAVRETSGEVLMHDGEPILARYFSTSGGHTFNNEDVFASSGPRPYLKGVPDPDDATSPLHRWEAVFTREQFDAIASRGQRLSRAAPVGDVVRLKRPGATPDIIRVVGVNGTTVEVTAGELRDFLNQTAPAAFPDEFPGLARNGLRPLPSTVPTGRYEIEVTEQAVILHGSGWGHGVGMGQYGAMGKAERGLTYDEILAAYYNGLRPTISPDAPERMRVGLTDVGSEVALETDRPFRVIAANQVLVERALGTWRVRQGPDRTLQLEAPAGFGAPLVASATTSSRERPFTVEQVALETVVNKPVELHLEVADPDGQVVATFAQGIVEAGRHRAVWSLDDADGMPLPAGSYRVRLVGSDEEGATAGEAVLLETQPVTVPGPNASMLVDLATTDLPAAGPAVAGATLVGFALGLGIGRRIRRSLR